MALTPELRERAEFCHRLARHCTDPDRRDSLMKLAEEFAARADAQQNDETGVYRLARMSEAPIDGPVATGGGSTMRASMPDRRTNRLLSLLSDDDYERLRPFLSHVIFDYKKSLYEPSRPTALATAMRRRRCMCRCRGRRFEWMPAFSAPNSRTVRH